MGPPPPLRRYTPANQGAAFNSGAKQRIIRMVEMQKDPMEPPKFKFVPRWLVDYHTIVILLLCNSEVELLIYVDIKIFYFTKLSTS